MWKLDLIIITSSIHLAELGFKDGADTLEEMGYGSDPSKARHKLKGKITNKELKESNNNTGEIEAPDFYDDGCG